MRTDRRVLRVSLVAAITFALGVPSMSRASVAGAGTPTCHGKKATITPTPGQGTIIGTPNDDVIVGAQHVDEIDGRGGDDTICGGDGQQRINGGAGHDLIDGGRGEDVLYGDGGNDVLEGKGSFDKLSGGNGDDIERGGPKWDEFGVDPGNDRIVGSPVTAANRCDKLDGDTLNWSGSSWLPVVKGPATVDLAAGTATSPGTGADTLVRIRSVSGSATGGDTLLGDSCVDSLVVNGPDSEVDGGDGADFTEASSAIRTIHGVHGGHDSGDVLRGGDGDDVIEDYGSLVASIDGGDGTDLASFGTVDVDLTAGTMTSDTSGLISGIENVFGDGTVVGDDQANDLRVFGPDSKAYGMGGDDLVIAIGSGDSLADGGDGTDACAGTNQVNCESQYHPPRASRAQLVFVER